MGTKELVRHLEIPVSWMLEETALFGQVRRIIEVPLTGEREAAEQVTIGWAWAVGG